MHEGAATELEQSLLPGYEEWLERLSATYKSVAHCCRYRLQDRAAAESISMEVVAEMLARPKVFRYFGLPFSGQLATLAEPRIARVRQGIPIGGSMDWQELLVRLHSVSKEHQEVFLLTCIEGYTDPEVAVALGCDEDAARLRRESIMGLLQELSRSVLAPTRREPVEEH
jgi:DNA-directed RNA polymerase specialized sigma24 family protein